MTAPTFQPQNPAINHYALGWSSCTSYSAAMAASFDRQVPLLVTGEAVRRQTGDTSGGTNLTQNDEAVSALTGIDLDVRYRYPWADFAARIDAGHGAILQGWYGPIANSRFDAGGGFTGNHAIFVPGGWGAMDPLADGRRAGIYKYHGEVYPQALLRDFAGQLNLGSSRLGAGLVYAAFTLHRADGTPPYSYQAHVAAGTTYRRYLVAIVNGTRKIVGRHDYVTAHGFTLPCTQPYMVRRGTLPETRIPLVKVTAPGKSYDGIWIAAKFAKEI